MMKTYVVTGSKNGYVQKVIFIKAQSAVDAEEFALAYYMYGMTVRAEEY